MITLEQIQLRLAEEIKHSGMSQTELGRRVGVSQSCIAHYIKGDIVPSLDTFSNLCEVLDLDPSYVLCLTN